MPSVPGFVCSEQKHYLPAQLCPTLSAYGLGSFLTVLAMSLDPSAHDPGALSGIKPSVVPLGDVTVLFLLHFTEVALDLHPPAGV